MLEGLVDEETAACLAAAQGPAAHPAGVGWLLEDVLVRTDERMGHVTAIRSCQRGVPPLQTLQ